MFGEIVDLSICITFFNSDQKFLNVIVNFHILLKFVVNVIHCFNICSSQKVINYSFGVIKVHHINTLERLIAKI